MCRLPSAPMSATLLSTGLACIIAAIIGGGLKTFGREVPILQSWRRAREDSRRGRATMAIKKRQIAYFDLGKRASVDVQ